ncbi:MAG: hypothetical protein GXX82_07040, partial [Syntrophorhabdus sp.]|nr:hypothetical protein [Syntrophorhabdus sp.]
MDKVTEALILSDSEADCRDNSHRKIADGHVEFSDFSKQSHAKRSRSQHVFLSRLFAELEQSNIRYAVMRNYESLPYGVDGSDLDILVAFDSEQRSRKVLLEVIEAVGAVAIGLAATVGFFKVYVLGPPLWPHGEWWGLRIDVNVGLSFKGAPLVGNAVLNTFQKHNGIFVLQAWLAGVLGVLKEVLQNNSLPERYLEAAREAVRSDWVTAQQVLEPMGAKALAVLRKVIIEDKAGTNARPLCRNIRRHVAWHALHRRPLQFVRLRILSQWSKILRCLDPPGVMVAILGADGVGKSTMIDAIRPVLEEATHNAFFTYHLRPSFLPSLARFKGVKSAAGVSAANPHGLKPSGRIGSLLRLTYHILDYVLGYWLEIRPRIARQPAVVLFDRYAYDMALDPRRFRIQLPRGLIWWFTRLAPGPDIIICLYGNPAVIILRKQELSVRELKRQTMELIR